MDENNMEKLERMSAKRKFKEEDENEEAEKIDIDVYCIMCQTYGHIPSEECVVRAVCFSCGFKGHVRRDCKEGSRRLKNIKDEEIKQESIKMGEIEQGTIKKEVKEESRKYKNECVEAEVLKDERKNEEKKIKVEVYCNLCQIHGHIMSKACIANAICLVCGIKGHIGRYCKEEKYEFKIIKSEVDNEGINYEDEYIEREVEMSGVKNSINEEAHKRPSDHFNEMCDLSSDLLQKMTPDYCGLCLKSINGKDVSRTHYEGKPHKKKLKLLEMERNPTNCDICNVSVSSEINLNKHLNGKMHKKKLELIQKQHNPDLFTCYLCQVSCDSQEVLKAHLNGKAHKKKLDLIEKGQNPASISHVSSEEPPEQENVVKELRGTFVTGTKKYFKLEIKEERMKPEIKECIKTEIKVECTKPELKIENEESRSVETHGSETPEEYIEPEISEGCLKLESKKGSVNIKEREGLIKEYIETEGLGVLFSKDYSFVLFHLNTFWIEGKQLPSGSRNEKLVVGGTVVHFCVQSFEGEDYKIHQAVAVWKGAKPDHLLEKVTEADYKSKLEEHRKSFMKYLRGEVFLRAALVRVKGELSGYLNDNIGIVDYDDGDTKHHVFFHIDDVKLFKKDMKEYKMANKLLLPVGVKCSVDARRVHIPEVKGIEYQAVNIIVGTWPTVPYPTLLPGGQGSVAPLYKEHIPTDGTYTFYYLELALEAKLQRQVNQLKEVMGKSGGEIKYDWSNTATVFDARDERQWREQFMGRRKGRGHKGEKAHQKQWPQPGITSVTTICPNT